MIFDQRKNLVFWGTGIIADACINQCPDIKPLFFIDSNWNTTEKFHGVSVYRPDQIEKWNELFIVIATGAAAYEGIEIDLKQKNLKQGENYISFRDFFGYHRKNIVDSLVYIKSFIDKKDDYANCTLIFTSMFVGRVSGIKTHFFRTYGQKKTSGKCVLFSALQLMNEEYAEKQIGFPVFDVPPICGWSGRKNQNIIESEVELNHVMELSADEREWIEYLEQRKICEDKEFSFQITAEIYWYFKNVFNILKPKEVIIWNSWSRSLYILAEISRKNNIPYGFMEYGWIPGTFQFERGGIAGQSEYAVNPEKILNLPIRDKDMDVKAVREYIRKTQLDNGKFRINDLDERNLSHMDRHKKTVFFVGMSDDGIGTNPQSEYWYDYVSAYFQSTLDAVLYVAEICEHNQWNFIFKPHPSTVNDTGFNPNRLPENIIFIKDMQIDRLIEIADVVVSIVSAVDYKALIYRKPLVSLGRTTLHRKGCCYEPENLCDIEKQLKMAMDQGMTEEQNVNFERHMVQLLENYLWDDLSERELRYGLSLKTDFFTGN